MPRLAVAPGVRGLRGALRRQRAALPDLRAAAARGRGALRRLRRAPAAARCLPRGLRYAWPWPDCVADFKFHGDTGWAGPLAQLLRAIPSAAALLDACDCVLPMPLAPGRLRERGFNQALELARRLAPGKTDAALLLRTRETPAQRGLSRAERMRNLQGAFAVEPLRADALAARRVVLVDDVMTTGASLFSAAQVLRRAGAAHVAGIVLARTDRPH